MENLTKNLIIQLSEFMTLAEFFRMKLINSKIKKCLEESQYLVFKREAFQIFCPLLFDPNNPFVNIEFSKKELRLLISKYPTVENDKAKEYFLFIRSIVRARKSLKTLFQSEKSIEVESSPGNVEEESVQFSKFVDTIIFKTLRYPSLPLPQNRDEIMQNVAMTFLQEYIYTQYGNQAKKKDDQYFSETASGRSSVISAQSPIKYRKISDLTRYVNDYFLSNQDQIKKFLSKQENEHFFKRFYYLRWYQCDPNIRDQKQINTFSSGLNRKKEPAEILIGLIEGLSDVLSEQCDFISQILFQDYNPKSNAIQLLEFYNTQWMTYSAALQQLDEEFYTINQIVNSIYGTVEKADDKEDYPFSILKLGMINWRYRVYKKNISALHKSTKTLVGQFQNHLIKQMMKKSNADSDDDASDSENEFEPNESGLNSINFLKVQYQKKDLIKQTIVRFSQSLADLSINPTNVFFLGSTKFQTEDTPYEKYAKLLSKNSDSFLMDEICPNKDIYENLNMYLREIEELTLLSVFKNIEKNLTEKSINIVKDKIKSYASNIVNKFKKQGQQVPQYSKKDDDHCLFEHALGKYIKGKQIPLMVQQQLVKYISREEISMFNNVYVGYLQSKRRYASIDDRFLQLTNSLKIHYDQDDCPFSKQKYRYSEIREDANTHLKQRYRTSLQNVQLNNEFAPLQQKGRLSLVPFRHSLTSVASETDQRRSDLFKDFGSLNRESTIFKNSNLDYGQMLDFFQGAGALTISKGPNSCNTKSDDLPTFQNAGQQDLGQAQISSSKRSLLVSDLQTDIQNNTDQNDGCLQTKQRSSSLPSKAQKQSSNDYSYQIQFEHKANDQKLDISYQNSVGKTRDSQGQFTSTSNNDDCSSDQYTSMNLSRLTPLRSEQYKQSIKDEVEAKEQEMPFKKSPRAVVSQLHAQKEEEKEF